MKQVIHSKRMREIVEAAEIGETTNMIMKIAELEEIVQLDDEDIEAMRDDAKAAEEEDYQQYNVYAWERSMNAKHTV